MTKSKWNRVDKAFTFLQERAATGLLFTVEELAVYTGWSKSTVQTYITKRWQGLLEKVDEQYQCDQSISTFDKLTFRQHHSQNHVVEKFFYQLLVEKAVTACVSAIEIYNKPDFRFREESFSILMVNAWELLLKAKILQNKEDDQESLWVKDQDRVVRSASGNPRTILLGGP